MRFVWAALTLTTALSAESVRGRVEDAASGEPLERVRVSVAGSDASAVTGPGGHFELDAPPGASLLISAAGYRPERAAAADGLLVRLTPDSLRRAERLDVTARAALPEAGAIRTMSSLEFQNTASVLVNDPLRSVQALPGVVANDDFQAQFSLRAAEFRRVGLVLDGVLLHSPFHTLQGDATAASATLFGGDILESVSLHPGPVPARFGDRTAGVAEMTTRPGARDRPRGRASASMSNVSGLAEGPLGRRGSWLAAARKSYLQYLIGRATDDDTIAFGFADAETRLDHELSASHRLRSTLMHGASGLDRHRAAPRLGLNGVMTSDYRFTLAAAAHEWAPSANWLGEHRIAWMRERWENRNRDARELGAGAYGEWIAAADERYRARRLGLAFGYQLRRMREEAYGQRQRAAPLPPLLWDSARGVALRHGAYAQPSWETLAGKLRVSAGARWDHRDLGGGNPVSPNASLTVAPAARLRLALAWGHAVQYAEIAQANSRLSERERTGPLLAERAHHASAEASLELTRQIWLRAEHWRRWDRDLLTRPFLEPRLVNGAVYSPPLWTPWRNAARMAAYGHGVTLQRRSANGVSGWMSYGWMRAHVRDGAYGTGYPADYEQRHTVNAFANWRARASVNLSARFMYGSATPAPGFYQGPLSAPLLSGERNRLRLPAYARLDLRANKTFQRDRYRWTLFAEVVNALNRRNLRYDGLYGFDPRTASARIGLGRTFPILPSLGFSFEF